MFYGLIGTVFLPIKITLETKDSTLPTYLSTCPTPYPHARSFLKGMAVETVQYSLPAQVRFIQSLARQLLTTHSTGGLSLVPPPSIPPSYSHNIVIHFC